MTAPEVVLAGLTFVVAVVNYLVSPCKRALAVALLAFGVLLLLIVGRAIA